MHPVELDTYVMPTNALEDFINVCVGWINSNVVGALVPGLQRIGKSWAVDYFVANYRKWLGNSVGVVSAEVLFHKGGISEGAFWGDLLKSMKRPTNKRRPEERRDLFVGRLVEVASRSEKKKAIIFMDEAQLLDELRAFRDGEREGVAMPRLLRGLDDAALDTLVRDLAALRREERTP